MGRNFLNVKKRKNLDLPTPLFIRDMGMIFPLPTSKKSRHWGVFKCPYCDNEFESNIHNVLSGHTKSCGCYNRLFNHNEQYLWHNQGKESPSITHGGSNTKLYYRWRAMINRICNPDTWNYKNYGGRGISICKEWQNDFGTFQEWAFNNGYEESLFIDRIDVNGDYCPTNCRWVNSATSSINRRHGDMYGIYKTHYYKYAVYFCRNRKKIYLGVFPIKEAIKVRDNYIKNEKDNQKTY